MATEIKVWQLIDGQLREIQNDDLAAEHQEKDLEQWIERDPSLLGSKLLVIARQYEIPGVGRLDLLCIDEKGVLVIVEFKRDLTNRDTIAQALDYASWLDSASANEIQNCAETYLEAPLSDAFLTCFGTELQSVSPQNHRVLVVAPKLDSSAERIINYLAERHGVDVNAVFFRYAKTRTGEEILIRTVLVPDSIRITSGPARHKPTVAQLLTLANDRKISPLVEVLRTMSPLLGEEPTSTYKGSFRYWYGGRMVCGVNVAGGRYEAPQGELDVWIPVAKLAEVSGTQETEIRQALKHDFSVTEGGTTDYVLRLNDTKKAAELVQRIRAWLAGRAARANAVSG